jgi:hypothetical protein
VGSPINLSPPGREILLQVQRPLEETLENSGALVGETNMWRKRATNLDRNSHRTWRAMWREIVQKTRKNRDGKSSKEKREMRNNFRTLSATFYRFSLSQMITSSDDQEQWVGASRSSLSMIASSNDDHEQWVGASRSSPAKACKEGSIEGSFLFLAGFI